MPPLKYTLTWAFSLVLEQIVSSPAIKDVRGGLTFVFKIQESPLIAVNVDEIKFNDKDFTQSVV